MTSVFASRRRAEEFHSLVETPHGGAARPVGDPSLEEFLAIVATLRTSPAPEPRPEFVTSLREELMAAADTLLVPASDERLTLPVRSTRRDRRIAAAIGGLAIVGAGTSMAVAAQSALPGEMLYPLKRAIEDAEAGVASSPDAKALTLLDSATSRLSEVQALGREGDLADEGGIVSTSFVDFGTQAGDAADVILDDYARTGDGDLIRELRDFTGDSMATLQALEGVVPESARDELLAAVDVVTDIDARAREACADCGGAGVDQVPPVLLTSAATESSVVVIPGATVEAWERPARERRGRDGNDGSGGGSLTTPIVGSPDGGSGSGDGSGSGSGATDPITGLTNGLTGEDPTASNDTPDLGGVVKNKAKDTVKDTVDDTTKKVGDTVEELGDSLLGD